MKRIEIKAPAKINIGLDVLSKRSDGFHNLNTLFYPIMDLFDTLIFERSVSFQFTCDSNAIPNDENNLVVKAVRLLEKKFKKALNVAITLYKNIPSQAGLGGGSSDAAATLISLNEMFQLGIKFEEMISLSVELGSDVPFFIKSRPAIGTSRGEILEFVELDIVEPILIVNPRINVSTKEAFLNIIPIDNPINYKSIISEEKLNYSSAVSLIKNDFEQTVFTLYPEIAKIKNDLKMFGSKFSLMSGTGSTVYGIFENEETAEIASKSFPQHYFTFISKPHL